MSFVSSDRLAKIAEALGLSVAELETLAHDWDQMSGEISPSPFGENLAFDERPTIIRST